MPKQEQAREGEINLQELLAHSSRLDQNLLAEQDEQLRQQAIADYGLIDPSAVKGGHKSGSSKVETQLRNEIEQLKNERILNDQQYGQSLVEWQERVTDLENMVTERDQQIERLGQQLDSFRSDPASTPGAGDGPKIPPAPAKVTENGAEGDTKEPNPFA